MSKKKKVWQIIQVILLLAPLLASIGSLVYLKMAWQVEVEPGVMLSPIDNKPLFVGLIIFSVGYLFFLGMLFSDNLLNMMNNRRSVYKR